MGHGLSHLLLDDQLEGLGDGAAFGRIGHRHLTHESRVRQIRPLRGLSVKLESSEHIPIEYDPEGRQHDADPALLTITKRFATDDLGNGIRGEPLWIPGHEGTDTDASRRITRHQITRIGQLLEIIRATAEEQIHAYPGI